MSEDLPWWGVWTGAGGKNGYGLGDPVQIVALTSMLLHLPVQVLNSYGGLYTVHPASSQTFV